MLVSEAFSSSFLKPCFLLEAFGFQVLKSLIHFEENTCKKIEHHTPLIPGLRETEAGGSL